MTLTLALLLVAQAQSWQVSLDSLARLGQFSGVVLVAQGGAPQFERAYGMADRESGRANDLETSFNLGSINKLFTGVAIRQLAAAGKLNIDSSLARAWPDYPNQDVARRVTIRQILEHRAGIQGNIFAAPPGKTRHDVVSLQDYFELFKDQPLQFDPGSRQQYSNAGYIVLGLLIEKVSGENYYEYVRRHIYEPAGMTQTGSWRIRSLAGEYRDWLYARCTGRGSQHAAQTQHRFPPGQRKLSGWWVLDGPRSVAARQRPARGQDPGRASPRSGHRGRRTGTQRRGRRRSPGRLRCDRARQSRSAGRGASGTANSEGAGPLANAGRASPDYVTSHV